MTWTSIPIDTTILLLSLPPAEPYAPPHWLASLVEHLRQHHQGVLPIDLNRRLFQEASEELQAAWDPGCLTAGLSDALESGPLAIHLDELAKSMAGSLVKVVGISIPPHGTGPACHLVRRLRAGNPDLAIIASGEGVEMESARKQLEEAGVDFLLASDRELSFSALVEPLLEGEEVPPTAGVIPSINRPQFPLEPPPPASLEDLPLPSFSDFNLDHYAPSPRGRYLPFRTSRGCLASCAFCVDQPREGFHRIYPSELLVDHLEMLVREHGVEQIEFMDLVLNGQPELIHQWCDALAARNLGLIWAGQGTFLPGMSHEVLLAMRRAGCISFRFGLDSGSDKILKAMGKPFDSALAGRILEDTRDVGLNASLSLLVGFPGETEADLRLTADFMQKHAGCINQVDLLATCELRAGCLLSIQPDQFGITLGGDQYHTGYEDAAGNTRETRNRSANGLLHVLTELGIPVLQVLDDHARSGKSNPNLEHHREALLGSQSLLNTVEVGPLQAAVSPQERQVLLFVGGEPITAPPGFTVLVRLNNHDLDLSCGRWRTWRDDQDTLHLESALLFAPGRLNLQIACPPDSGLVYQVELFLEEPATLQNVRLGLFPHERLRRFLGPKGWGDLALPPDATKDLILSPAPTEYLLLAEGEDAIPEDKPPLALALHPTDQRLWQIILRKDPRGTLLILQRPPSSPRSGGDRELEPGFHLLHSGRLDWVTAEAMERAVKSGSLRPEDERMAEFCLIQCPLTRLNHPPHLLAQLAGALRGMDFSGSATDLNAALHGRLGDNAAELWDETAVDAWQDPDKFAAEIWPLLEKTARELLEPLIAEAPGVMVLIAGDAGVPCSLQMARLARQLAPDIGIVLCGTGVYWTTDSEAGEAPFRLLNAETGAPLDQDGGVDVILRGEAEETLPQLLHHLHHDLDLLEVPGAVVWREASWQSGDKVSPVAELDRLPMADYSGLDLAQYETRVLPIEASRGCMRNCVTCRQCRMLHPHRVRGPLRLHEEIEQLVQRYAPEALEFTDLAINGDLEQLEQLCDLFLDQEESPTPWQAVLMVRPDMNRILVKRMALAGCRKVKVAVGSLSPQVLQAMRKGFDLDQMERMIGGIRETGIEVGISLMVGFPRETPELFQETLDNLARLKDIITRVDKVTTCGLAHGSRLWEDPAIFGIDTQRPDFWRSWRGPFGNTADERLRRKEQLLAAAEKLGLR